MLRGRLCGALALAVATSALMAGGGVPPASASGRTGNTLGSPAKTVVARDCVVPTGKGPGYDASIGVKQNGERVCIKVGETLLVTLNAPTPKGPDWSRIAVSPAGILGSAPLKLFLPIGMTATNFRALRAGTVSLSSVRHACPPATPGQASCDAMEAWRATVVVLAG